MLDTKFGVFLQRLGPMEVAKSFTPIDGNLRIFGPVDNPHNIPIGLHTVRHQSSEMKFGDSMPSHDMVEFVLGKHLSIIILRLEVTTMDGHDALVGTVIYVVSHGGPLGDTFDMVRQDPNMFEIPVGMYALNQVDTTTRADVATLASSPLLTWSFVRLSKGYEC